MKIHFVGYFMSTKHFPIMKACFSRVHQVVLVALVFTVSHCVDHDLDPLVIKTLPIAAGITFSLEAITLGKKPVTEYGIVYTGYPRALPTPHNMTPTIDDHRIPFPTAIKIGLNQYVFPSNFFQGRTFFYYRAYAILNDGTVVYSFPIGYRFPDPF